MPAIIHLSGNVGGDVRQNKTNAGGDVVSFRLADHYKQDTTWYTVTCFGRLATYAAEAVSRGCYVHAWGRLKRNEYDTKRGEHMVDLEVLADGMEVRDRQNAQGEAEEDGTGL